MKQVAYVKVILVGLLVCLLWGCAGGGDTPQEISTQGTIEIKEYRIGWSSAKNYGVVIFKLANGEERKINVRSTADLSGWAAVLEHKPAYINAQNDVWTGLPQGEQK
jgi:hypothetical protein